MGSGVSRKVGEHVYLAFTDTNMDHWWQDDLRQYGFRKNPNGSPEDKFDNPEYGSWLTFSYHPTAVRKEKVDEKLIDMSGSPTSNGNRALTLHTKGWDIIFNDYNSDIKPLGNEPQSGTMIDRNDKRNLYLLTTDKYKQKDLMWQCMYYYRNRGTDAYWDYSLMISNCGSWAQDVVRFSGLSWPSGINHGLGTRGGADYTMLPQTFYAGSAVYGEVKHFLGHIPYVGFDNFGGPSQ